MLDGGLQRWKFREYPVYHGPPPTITPQEYNAKFDDRLVRTFDEMVENFNSKKEQVLSSLYMYLHTVIFELFVTFYYVMTDPFPSLRVESGDETMI